MAGLFDFHVTTLLQSFWRETMAPSPDAFKAMFQRDVDGQYAVPEAMLDRWHERLTDNPEDPGRFVQFTTAWSDKLRGYPVVAVGMEDEPIEQQPLGLRGPPRGGKRVSALLTRESVAITIFAPHEDLARALHIFVRTAMMSNIKWLADSGYKGLVYQGGSDLHPDPNLMPEALGIFIRAQRWSSISEATWTLDDAVSKPAFVYAEDILVGSNQGGMSSPIEEE